MNLIVLPFYMGTSLQCRLQLGDSETVRKTSLIDLYVISEDTGTVVFRVSLSQLLIPFT